MLSKKINQSVETLFEQQQEFLKQLIRVPSVRGQETPAQEIMADKMRSLGASVDEFGIDLEKISQLPGFSPVTCSYENALNVVGTFGNRQGTGRSLIMNGHIDVVPAGPLAQWTKPPYEPYVQEGRLYGRGSADMKAGLCAKVFALQALRALGYEPDAPVYLQSVVEEECTGNGALACLAQGYKADAVLIGEPFNDLVRAQIGVIWFQVKLHGRPAHALNASTSNGNAIEAIVPLIKSLRELERQWNHQDRRHPLYADHCHPLHLNIGEVHGGDWTSSTPAWALLNLRMAIFPGDSINKAKHEIETWIAKSAKEDELLNMAEPQVNYHGFLAEGYHLEEGSRAEEYLKLSHRETLGRELLARPLTATTDARFFGLYQKTPSLVYGPKGENIHGFDEYVDLASLLEVTQVYANFIERWCGLRKIQLKSG